MGEFINGRKRKTGIVMLVLACLFAGAWVRSLCVSEFLFIEFEFPFGGRINVYTRGNQMDVLLQRSTGWYFKFGKVDSTVKWKPLNGVWLFDVQEIAEVVDDGVLQVAAGFKIRIYFYAIVLPLTLLSAYLLLAKRRVAKPQKPLDLIEPRERESWAGSSRVGGGKWEP